MTMKKLMTILSVGLALGATGVGSTGVGLALGATANANVNQQTANANVNQQTVKANATKATRLTSTRRAGYSWLLPNNKESFKQSRRKQLAKRSNRKARKNGQA